MKLFFVDLTYCCTWFDVFNPITKKEVIQIRTCMYDALAVQCFWMCLKFYNTDVDGIVTEKGC